MTLGERIKLVRKENGLTLEAFGGLIGISNPAVSRIERGLNNPSSQTILLICREFHVREEWLREGIEPMRDTEPAAAADEIDEFLDKLGLPRSVRGLFVAYRELPSDEDRAVVVRFIENAALKIAAQSAAANEKEAELDIEAEVEAYRQELLERKRAAEESEASETAPGLLA